MIYSLVHKEQLYSQIPDVHHPRVIKPGPNAETDVEVKETEHVNKENTAVKDGVV